MINVNGRRWGRPAGYSKLVAGGDAAWL